MPDERSQQRLRQAARDAHAAEARGDDAAANEAWRRYRLIVVAVPLLVVAWLKLRKRL